MSTMLVPQFTPAGRQFITFLGTFNSGDRDALRRWIGDHFSASMLERQPVDLRVAYFLSLYQQTGRLRIKGIEESDDYNIIVMAQATTNDTLMRITLRVEPDAPYPISEFSAR
jgi:hypothetical protein